MTEEPDNATDLKIDGAESSDRAVPNGAALRVQSVVVAHQVLEALGASRGGATLGALATKLGMTPPRVLRHLITLTDLQLVERSGSEPVYRLGIGVIRLAEDAAAQHDVVRLAEPELRQLNLQSGEATYLVCERGGEAVVWSSFVGSQVPHLSMPPGMGFSLTGSACGRVLLAFAPPRDDVPLAATPTREFPDPIPTISALKARLAAVRETHFDSHGTEESNAIYSLAAPLLDHRGRAVAAIGLIGFSMLYRQRAEHLRACLEHAARSVSQSLGWQGEWPD